MLSWEAALESVDGYVIIVTLYLIVHLLVPVRVGFQGLPFLHGQSQQRIQGPRNPATHDEARSEGLGQLLKEPTEFGLRPSNHLIAIGPKFIFGMDGHPLIKLTYVLYGVRFVVVHSEGGLMELPRKFSPFYLACEG